MLSHNASADKARRSPTGLILHALLKIMAANFNHRSALKTVQYFQASFFGKALFPLFAAYQIMPMR